MEALLKELRAALAPAELVNIKITGTPGSEPEALLRQLIAWVKQGYGAGA